MNVKGAFGEVSEGNEGHVIRNWREGYPCYKVAENLAELYSTVRWKTELVNHLLGYLAEEIFNLQCGICYLVSPCFLEYERKEIK